MSPVSVQDEVTPLVSRPSPLPLSSFTYVYSLYCRHPLPILLFISSPFPITPPYRVCSLFQERFLYYLGLYTSVPLGTFGGVPCRHVSGTPSSPGPRLVSFLSRHTPMSLLFPDLVRPGIPGPVLQPTMKLPSGDLPRLVSSVSDTVLVDKNQRQNKVQGFKCHLTQIVWNLQPTRTHLGEGTVATVRGSGGSLHVVWKEDFHLGPPWDE